MKLKISLLLSFGWLLMPSCNHSHMDHAHSEHMTPSHKTTLISVEKNISIDEWSLKASDLGTEGANWGIKMVELEGGKQDDVQLIKVDNGALKFTVIPTRGMSIHSVEYEDVTLGWDSPVKEMVHPKFISLEDNGGLGWLDGFNEWMVRCGMEFAGHPGMDNGQMLTLHGKIGNIPASEVEVVVDEEPPHRIRIRGKVIETWFKGPNLELWTEVSTVPGSNSFRIDDVLTNKSPLDQEFMVIYHANFGPPLLENGSRLMGTIEKVLPFDDFAASDVSNWASYGQPVLNTPERVYCLFPSADNEGNAHFLFQNATGDKGVSFIYPKEQLPYFAQWKNQDTNGHVTGLEPSTGFPHNRSVERKYGRVPVLKSGDSRHFSLEYIIHTEKADIQAVEEKIKALTNKEIEISSVVIKK